MRSRRDVNTPDVSTSTTTSTATRVDSGPEENGSLDQQHTLQRSAGLDREMPGMGSMQGSRATALGTTVPSPMHFLRESIHAVPAVKYALGIGGIVATISVGYSFKVAPHVAVIGTIVMLTLMSILVIFSRMTSISSSRAIKPVLALTWFSLILFIVVSGTLFTCVFFGKPRDLSSWLTAQPEPRAIEHARTGYVSEFAGTLPMNSSFDEVRAFFEMEALRIRSMDSADDPTHRIAKLVDHYVAERTQYYIDFRDRQSHELSAPKAEGAAIPGELLAVNCPNNMIIAENGAAVIEKEGSCFGPIILSNKTGATGMVLHDPAGRSACKLVAMCQYTWRYIESAVMRERAVLSNLAR